MTILHFLFFLAFIPHSHSDDFIQRQKSPLPMDGSLLTESSLPSRAKRMEALEKSGLLEFASNLDELDQDIFYYRAKTKPLEELKKLYPKLNKKQLLTFKNIVRTH